MTDEKTTETKGPSIGDIACQAIRDNKTNEQVLACVLAEFPDAKTSSASVNWYRNKLKSDGESIMSSREAKAAQKAAEAPAATDETDPLDD